MAFLDALQVQRDAIDAEARAHGAASDRIGRVVTAGDPRSGIVDTLSTRVTDKRLVKLLVWYDNEWGYANRLVELAAMVARAGRAS